MSWEWVNQTAYGVHIQIGGNPQAERDLFKYRDLLNSCDELSAGEMGTTFVYIKSTHTELASDYGLYSVKPPDTRGTAVLPPKHPCFCFKDDEPSPTVTFEEIEALFFFEQTYPCAIKDFMWMNSGSIN